MGGGFSLRKCIPLTYIAKLVLFSGCVIGLGKMLCDDLTRPADAFVNRLQGHLLDFCCFLESFPHNRMQKEAAALLGAEGFQGLTGQTKLLLEPGIFLFILHGLKIAILG
jgi:hypothetical protein